MVVVMVVLIVVMVVLIVVVAENEKKKEKDGEWRGKGKGEKGGAHNEESPVEADGELPQRGFSTPWTADCNRSVCC